MALQATLFPLSEKPLFLGADPDKNRVRLRNPAFMENKSLPVHRWVPWIAGFSAGFISDCFARFLPDCKTPRILDPFAGVGTTLVEAVHKVRSIPMQPWLAGSN